MTGSPTGNNTAYTLAAGNVTLTGNAAIDVANNGNGTGTLNLGALNDGGTATSLTINPVSSGTITIGKAANTMNASDTVNVNGGTVN